MPGDHVGQSAIARCGIRLPVSCGSGSAPRLNWNAIRPAYGSKAVEKGLVDVGGVDVALGGAGHLAPGQRGSHLRVAHRPEVDVAGNVRGQGNDRRGRQLADEMGHRLVHVVQRADRPLDRRPLRGGVGNGAAGRLAPAPLQLVEGRVELAPLGRG